MWPFKKKPKALDSVQEPPGKAFDYKGQDIFRLLEQAMENNGLRLIRGSGSISHDKWGDGEWHFRGRAETIPDSGIGLFIDDVEMDKGQWNQLSQDQRRNYCQHHVVTLRYRAE